MIRWKDGKVARADFARKAAPADMVDLITDLADALDVAVAALRDEHSLRLGYRFRNGLPIESTADTVLKMLDKLLDKLYNGSR